VGTKDGGAGRHLGFRRVAYEVRQRLARVLICSVGFYIIDPLCFNLT